MNPLILPLLLSSPFGANLLYELDHDFRTTALETTFRLVGADAKQYIRSGPKGLVISLPAGSKPLPAIGAVTRPAIEGDFQIIAAFEILNVEKPDSGYGSGASLYIQTDSDDKSAASIARSLTLGGETVYVTNRIREVGGKKAQRVNSFPARSPSFRLCVTRTGSMMNFSVAEGDDPEFSKLDEVELGTGGVNWVQVSASPGGARTPLDVRVESLRMRATTLPGGIPIPGASSLRVWVVAAALTVAVLALAVGLWRFGRTRRSLPSTVQPSQTPKAEPRPGPPKGGRS